MYLQTATESPRNQHMQRKQSQQLIKINKTLRPETNAFSFNRSNLDAEIDDLLDLDIQDGPKVNKNTQVSHRKCLYFTAKNSNKEETYCQDSEVCWRKTIQIRFQPSANKISVNHTTY